MAHIASCMTNLDLGYISSSLSPAQSMLSTISPRSSLENPVTWRMFSTAPKKYHLYPKNKPLPSLKPNKTPGHKGVVDAALMEKQGAGSGLRHRADPEVFARRRKVSVPELGPMTTVHEVPMDSPTIPGRPPVHERSASVPTKTGHEIQGEPKNVNAKAFGPSVQLSGITQAQSQSLSRQLSPLVLPIATLLQSRKSSAKLRSNSTPTLLSRSAGTDTPPSSRKRLGPSSSAPDLSSPEPAITDGASSTPLPSPLSTIATEHLCLSPKTLDSASFKSAQTDHSLLSATSDGHRKPHIHHHHRGISGSLNFDTDRTDRSRPRKGVDVRNNSNNGLLVQGNENNGSNGSNKDGSNKRAISVERRAFEELPKGWQPAEAIQKLSASDLFALQTQAHEQAECFEVLKVEDVEALSKELRQLDERTEYLRRTQTSLRSGRRNLHSRICQYLRSPRVAKFSPDSMLKQEEALSELDASIDDWVAKLEQAENRRTRVRQKLLEHVAAAAIIVRPQALATLSESLQKQQAFSGTQSPMVPRELFTPPRSPFQSSFVSRVFNASPSPQRVAAQVPSTIFEQPVLEDEAGYGSDVDAMFSASASKQRDTESIRIYAGHDVFTLLADVESEMFKMGSGDSSVGPLEHAAANEDEAEDRSERDRRRERQDSHERLHGYSRPQFISPWSSRRPAHKPVSRETSPTTANWPSPVGPTAVPSKATGAVPGIFISINADDEGLVPHPLTPVPNNMTQEAGPFLTSAVFKP